MRMPTDVSRLSELIAASLLLLLALVGYFAVPQLVSGWAFAMPGTTDAALAPTFFPQMALVILGLTALGVILTLPQREEPVPLVEMTGDEMRRAPLILGVVALYFVGLFVIGFILSSVLFVLAVTYILKFSKPRLAVIVAVLVPVATAAVFRFGMKVLLPGGLFDLSF